MLVIGQIAGDVGVTFAGIFFPCDCCEPGNLPSSVQALNVPADAYQDACDYMKTMGCGTVLVFGYNAVCSVLKGLGDSRSPLCFVGIATIINVFLDIILVGPFKMGTAGSRLRDNHGTGNFLCDFFVLSKTTQGVFLCGGTRKIYTSMG